MRESRENMVPGKDPREGGKMGNRTRDWKGDKVAARGSEGASQGWAE